MATKKPTFRAADGVVVRTPLLPLAEVCRHASRGYAESRAWLAHTLDDSAVLEALWLASPSLVAELDVWRESSDSPRGQRIERSIYKYLARLSTRSTPFGTFAGVSVATLARTSGGSLGGRESHRRRTRIDNDFLYALAADIHASPELRAGLSWRPNSSLYQAAGALRYAEARLDGRERSYHLVSIEPTWYLSAVLDRAADGATIADLAQVLTERDDEIEAGEAEAFVGELIDAQILVSELGVTVTGPEPIEAFIANARAAGLRQLANELQSVASELASIDANGLGAAPAGYEALAARLTALRPDAKSDVNKLFQVDLAKPADSLQLPQAVARDVADAMVLLARIFPSSPDAGIKRFIEDYQARYEDREMPLADVLDEDTGIGFERAGGPGTEGSPLLANLPFPPPDDDNTAPWNPRERLLLRLAHDAGRELVLDDELLRRFELEDSPKLPTGASALVRVAADSPDALDAGDYRVLISGFGGASGAQLLGRFCGLDDDIHTLVRDHLRAEEAREPEAVFAEVVHLNEGRIGNIQCRPVLRDYEIPFLGLSGAPRDRQLPITDLMVSVRRGRVVLRSRSLDREVIPRLSTAHNFRLRSLGVYRFLCALQSQHGRGAAWNWGPAGSAPFLPRVVYRRAVLSRATWNIAADELRDITAAARADKKSNDGSKRRPLLDAVAALRQSRDLPRHIVLASGDNELHIDLDDELAACVLGHELAGDRPAQLAEAFPAPDQLILRGDDGAYASELSLLLTRTDRADDANAAPRVTGRPEHDVPVRFAPGSSWLYAKIYTGPGGADRVLRDAITPVVETALGDALADRWFFLRYADPDHHLRVRFRGEPTALHGELLLLLQERLEPLLAEGLVARVQLDTYQRELQRYGGPAAIDLAEELFCADSHCVIDIVNLLEGDEGKDARWRLGLLGTHMLMADLGFDAAASAAIIDTARASFGREFRVDANLGRELGRRFRAERADLSELLAISDGDPGEHWLAPGIELLQHRSTRIRPIAERLRAARDQLWTPLPDITWSYIHMHLNRILHASHRAQELVIYDLLKRLYASRRPR